MEFQLYRTSVYALQGVVEIPDSAQTRAAAPGRTGVSPVPLGVSPSAPLVAALIPCFNEAESIAPLVQKISPHVRAVWIVDDGSQDATRRAAERAGAVVLRHEINLGKGAS